MACLSLAAEVRGIKRWRWLLSVALGASTIPNVATVQAAEENTSEGTAVSLDEIPAPAREAIQSAAGGGQVMEVIQDTRQGEAVYHARIRQPLRFLHIEVDGTGNVLSTFSS